MRLPLRLIFKKHRWFQQQELSRIGASTLEYSAQVCANRQLHVIISERSQTDAVWASLQRYLLTYEYRIHFDSFQGNHVSIKSLSNKLKMFIMLITF